MDPVTEVDALLRGHAHDARERLDDAVQGTRERLEVEVQTHPLRAVLMALGAGVLVGVLLGMGRKRRSG